MKSKTFALMLASVFVVAALAEDGVFPKIEFKYLTKNIGVVTSDSVRRTAVYEFTNVGEAPLVIIGAKVTCDCLTVDFPHDSIPVDSAGVVRVTYDASSKSGPENVFKQIRLYTNCEVPTVSLTIKGTYTAAPDTSKVKQ